MQLPTVAALAAAALGGSAVAKLNPFSHPILEARYAPPSADATTPPMNATKPINATARFLNANTEPYVVTSLPEVNFQFGEMYAGMIPLDSSPVTNASATGGANSSAVPDEMFFIFMPKEGGEPVDELTIWLNGGPGCSSMEGFLQEVGPISWHAGTHSPERNKYAWTNLTNMLFVDQPIGTGCSRGTPSAQSQPESAAQFLAFLKKFQTLFGISNFRIFLTGESYAGRYIPYIAEAMLDAHDTVHFNISGAIIYAGTIGNDLYTKQVVTFQYVEENWSHFLFDAPNMVMAKGINQECGYEDYFNKYMTFPPPGIQPPRLWHKGDPQLAKCDLWNSVLIGVLSGNPCFDPYEINKSCPMLWDVLGMTSVTTIVPPGTTVYFDRPDVKKALHVPADLKWEQCSKTPVFVGGGGKGGVGANGDLSPDPAQGALPRVIDATQRVLVANGDLDFVVITNGTLLSIQNMTWGGALGFQTRPSEPLHVPLADIQWRQAFADSGLGIDQTIVPQGQMGLQHFERGLMWNQVWGAGHMVPAYQPRVAYMQLLWMLGHIDTLGPDVAAADIPGDMGITGNGTASGNVATGNVPTGNNSGAMPGAAGAGNGTSGPATGGNAMAGGNATGGGGMRDGSAAGGGNTSTGSVADGNSAGSGAGNGVAGPGMNQAASGAQPTGDASSDFVAWASSEITVGGAH